MRVIESFFSIQGEGAFAGRAAYFLRLAGCNFRCAGFGVEGEFSGQRTLGCDTQRATYGAANARRMSAKEVLSELAAQPPNALVVITGGEPLLQQHSAQFQQLLSALSKRQIQFETNGTVEIASNLAGAFASAHFAIGYKTAASGEQKRLNIRAICSLIDCGKGVFFKLVLSSSDVLNAQKFARIFALVNEQPLENLSPAESELASLSKQLTHASACELAAKQPRCMQLLSELINQGALSAKELAELSFERFCQLGALAEAALLRVMFPRVRMFFMPLGATSAELSEHANSVAQAAILLGCDYSDRLHIRLWDDKEGV